MKKYHKIQTVFKRDSENNFKTLLDGQYSIPEFKYLKDNKWELTEKVDGTNIRIIFDWTLVEFKGKTDNAQIPPFLFSRLMEIFSDCDKWIEVFKIEQDKPISKICLYGEGYGARINKGGGKYMSDGVDFVLFDIKIDDWWLRRADVYDIAEKLEIKHVPVIGYGTLKDAVELAKNKPNSNWGMFEAEGIVMRPMVELFTRNGERIITKIKAKDFK